MISIENYTSDLYENDGILFSKAESKISYPEVGNEHCYQIEENSFWFKHRNNCIAEAVQRYCAANAVFFDIGGGNGFVAKGLENAGITTILVEPGIQGCLNAKKRNLKNIVCATLENASFKQNSLPAIGLFDVVEHIEADVAFLTTIHQLLTENGLVFITVPAYQTLWSNEDNEAGHFRRYTKKDLADKLKKVGFKIEYSSYIFSILIVAVFAFRALPSKLGFYKNGNDLASHKKDHEAKSGLIDKLLNLIWNAELNAIKTGKIIPFGGSCFLVARKVTN